MSSEVSREEFDRLDHDVNGNGQPGMRQDIQAIREDLAAMRGAADQRAQYMTWLLAALTIAVALMAIPSIAHAIHVGELKIPRIFIPHHDSQLYTAQKDIPQLSDIR